MRGNRGSCITMGVALLGSLLASAAGAAVVSYDTAGSTYTQSFDALANTGSNVTWTNGETLPGVFAFSSKASASPAIQRGIPDDVPVANWQPPANYQTSATSSSQSLMYSFGASSSTDRALGNIGGPSATTAGGDFFYAFVLRNDTAADLTNVSVSYTGEQWREARVGNDGVTPAATQYLRFSYLIEPTFDAAADVPTQKGFGAYTQQADLDFASPTTGNTTTSYIVLDGNATANRTALTATLGGASPSAWGAGQYLVLRFWDDDDNGFDHGLAIDDLSVTAQAATPVPEPATAGVFAAALALAGLRRRRITA